MNNDNEHTPGPWFWNPYRTTITQADPSLPPQPDKHTVALFYQGHGVPPPRPADARLIAAAPDLLAALEAIANPRRGTPEETWDVQEIGDFARAAIAKATGAESARSNGCKLSDGCWPRTDEAIEKGRAGQ